jgi:hypothetical protein
MRNGHLDQGIARRANVTKAILGNRNREFGSPNDKRSGSRIHKSILKEIGQRSCEEWSPGSGHS